MDFTPVWGNIEAYWKRCTSIDCIWRLSHFPALTCEPMRHYYMPLNLYVRTVDLPIKFDFYPADQELPPITLGF